MEGMVWNANHVLDLALMPAIKKPGDILKDAKGIIIMDTVDVGIVLAGTRGSGVLMAKNADGSWSAPSAVTLTALKIGWFLGAKDKGLIFVFDEEDAINRLLSGVSFEIGAGLHNVDGNEQDRKDDPAINFYLSSKGAGAVKVYSYKVPPSFDACSLDTVNINIVGKANTRFYGKEVSPFDIVRKGDVTIPDGSGIPDLQKKLAQLENNQVVEPTSADVEKKESLRQSAVASSEAANKEEDFEIEELAMTA